MKAGWKTEPLINVATLEGRIGWKGLTAKEYTSEGPHFLSVHSLNYGDYVDFRDAFHISQQRYDESPEIMLRRDDILICKDGAGIGKVGIVGDMPGPTTINSSLLLIRPQPSILPKYLYFILQSPYFQQIVQSRLEGATTPHLYQRDIATFPVHFPPIEEQRQIVAVLNEAFAAIATATANAEKNLANARELFSSELRYMFDTSAIGWGRKAIGEVANARLGKMLDKAKNKGLPKPYLRNLNVRWFEFDLSDVLEMPFEESENEKYSARRGDLLIVEGGYPGRAAIWDNDEPIYFQKAIHRVRFADPRLAKILMYMLFAQHGDGSLKQHFTGSGIQHLTAQSLGKIEMPLPPVGERDAIIERIEGILAISVEAASVYRLKLSALAALKQSLLHSAFTGEVTALRPTATTPANDDRTTPEFGAQILAFSYYRHVALNRAANFGHVKAQKTLHSVEALGGLNLGRQPIKDAAGPNDFAHMRCVEVWAKEQGFFDFVKRASGGYNFRPLQHHDRLLKEAKRRLDEAGPAAKRAIEILVDTDSDWAEILMTTHAAWNNLILDNTTITDDAIVHAARDGWHPAKLRHEKSRFHDALRYLRNNGMEPDGSAKRVGGQEALLF